MAYQVKKAIFPVGGLGTRFLPATKAMPKEMLPIVDKPLIQYAVEEARAAGIEEFIFVSGRGKTALEDHFDFATELNDTLRRRNKQAELELANAMIVSPGEVVCVRQQEPKGLGHAVWCARHLVGDEPVAVLLADDLVLAETPCLQQMAAARREVGAGGEIQLTDALAKLIGGAPFHGYRFEGERFDCGDKVGFLEANIAFAL